MKISLAICSYNRYEKLKILLDTLKKQIEASSFVISQINRVFEVILVDNNSSDETSNLKKFSIDKHEFKYLCAVKPGLSAARNKAIREFSGDLLCFLDDDVKPEYDFISILLKLSKRDLNDIGILGARVKLPDDIKSSKFFEKYKNISPSVFPEHDYGKESQEYPFKYNSRTIENPIGACFVTSKSVLEKMSMFNENLGVGAKKFGATLHEDTEFFRRAKVSHIPLEYFPELCVEHPLDEDRLDTKRIYNWYFNSGKSFVLLAKHKPEIFSKQNQAEFIGVPSLLLKFYQEFLILNS